MNRLLFVILIQLFIACKGSEQSITEKSTYLISFLKQNKINEAYRFILSDNSKIDQESTINTLSKISECIDKNTNLIFTVKNDINSNVKSSTSMILCNGDKYILKFIFIKKLVNYYVYNVYFYKQRELDSDQIKDAMHTLPENWQSSH